MTNEEAIKIFNIVLLFGKCDLPKEETEECLKMAIEALKKDPKELSDDHISRMSIIQKLSARFLTFAKNTYGGYDKCDKSIRDAMTECLTDIVYEPSVKPKSAWIPVSVCAKAPEKGDTYLVTVHDQRIFKSGYGTISAYYNKRDNQWVPDDEWIKGEVVAWMPMPEPYKVESEE